MTAPTTARPRPSAQALPPPPRPPRPVRRHGSALAEAALAGLTLAAAIDLSRLFRNPASFLAPVALTLIAVHLACAAMRRAGLGLGVAALGSVVAGGLVLSWTVLPAHTTFALPTRETLHAANQALTAAMDQFRGSAPPAVGAPGFVLASGFGCAVAAFLADWAAFRMRATTEACLPSLSLFVFSAALAQGHGATLAAAVWLTALLGFLLVREAGVDQPPAAWFASRSAQGPAAILRVGAKLTIVAVLLAVVIGPRLPGATTRALVTWRTRDGSGGGRTTTSPLVDIRARIVDQSTVEVFTVAADRPAYWRLTSLDNFDGNGWSLNDTYKHAKGTLPGPPPSGVTVNASFSVSNLSSIWLPAPYRPVHYNGPGKVSYSAGAGSLIADKATTDGLVYQVQAVTPTPDPAALRAAPAPTSDPTLAQDTGLPTLPREVFDTALAATAGATTNYDRALRLQNFFRREFTYDLNVAADDGSNAIVAFLRHRRGFCQQFAGTYAAMARALGLPARVAVGFTPGDLVSDGRYHVRGEHAHAWPEVWFGGIGWVAFEPTPGRGVPGAQGYTFVPPQQADRFPSATPTTLPAPSTNIPSLPTSVPHGRARTDQGGTSSSRNSSPLAKLVKRPWFVLAAAWGVVVLLLGTTPVVVWLRRRKRRARATTPASQALVAWAEAREQLTAIGARPRPSETPHEYAARAVLRTRLPEEAAAVLTDLAEQIVEIRYSPDPGVAAADWFGACATITEVTTSRQTWWERMVGACDPRQLWR